MDFSGKEDWERVCLYGINFSTDLGIFFHLYIIFILVINSVLYSSCARTASSSILLTLSLLESAASRGCPCMFILHQKAPGIQALFVSGVCESLVMWIAGFCLSSLCAAQCLRNIGFT